MSDWYKITKREVRRRGGDVLFENRQLKLEEVLREIYPDYSWVSSKFLHKRTQQGHWKDKRNLQGLLTRAERKLGIEKVRRCGDV